MSVKKKTALKHFSHVRASAAVSMESYSPPCCRRGACVCVVWEYISVWTEPHGRVPVEGMQSRL